MSIVAISQTLGSLGDRVGLELARTLGYEFADREVILRAAERFGGDTMGLYRVTEGRPTLWERFTSTRQHYRTYIEAILWELAARDNVVLVGRGSVFVLQRVRHALRLRITASEETRARRVEQLEGLAAAAAMDRVRESELERATRVRFLSPSPVPSTRNSSAGLRRSLCGRSRA